MPDPTDDGARPHLPTRNQRLPQRAPGAAWEAEAGHPVPLPGQPPANERPYREPTPADVPRHPLRAAGPSSSGEEETGYVIHLPVRVHDVEAAARLAYTVASSLAFLPELDPGDTTVSTADDQNNRHRVFCDQPLSDRSRCPRRHDHRGPCGQVEPGDDRGPVPSPRDRP